MTPLYFLLPFAKPPPARQEQLRLLEQTLDACALALNCLTQLRATLAAIQTHTAPASHQHLLARLSVEVLDNYAAQLQHINATAQSEHTAWETT
ncbi:hypothetical protein JD974_05795 [Chromobacterium haemolyticum]|uniref:DUF1484 domain-containing protein n=1 Tax=Chromobacterium haemolyticum TaxID=394935 RepID=A0ABS3GK26_9NEIS|nr:hypothetical protein [Chromobacterium haemolyticum]MBK0413916.1 hypothetical protein [Chromobacterium haemolyticum]MBO0415397.1 hypothetical protein [Chromobacterium haemolyticum]MBO0498658.1 hypothetical protein [Chromobacterium haemolyticum]